MLYIGEQVGRGACRRSRGDIAVDPLEGTNLCATGSPNAIAVLAASNRGGLLHAPDCYMEKIVVGPAAHGAVHLDAPVKDNLKAIAKRLDRAVSDLVVIVLDRPRHEKLIEDIRSAGARIRLITDGDLSAGISAAVRRTNVHAVMGIGGAPEGVLDRGGAALPQRRHAGAPGAVQDRGRGAQEVRGAPEGHGHHRSEPHLHRTRPGARPRHPVRRQRRHRRQPPARRALLRPRRAHQLGGDERCASTSSASSTPSTSTARRTWWWSSEPATLNLDRSTYLGTQGGDRFALRWRSPSEYVPSNWLRRPRRAPSVRRVEASRRCAVGSVRLQRRRTLVEACYCKSFNSSYPKLTAPGCCLVFSGCAVCWLSSPCRCFA